MIAILDSGIDLTHPDLAANLYVNAGEIPDNGVDDDGNGFIDDVHGWDFANEDNDPQDDNGHGTFVAGIAGAVANNGVGIAGVAWRVSLLPLKFLDDQGGGTTANAIRALDYAITMGVGITNNSWGGGPYSQALCDAITVAHQAGVAFVASAGGSSRDLDVTPVYPVCYDVPNVVPVAATDENDLLSSLSDYGDETVDLAAPGVSILTTQPGGEPPGQPHREAGLPVRPRADGAARRLRPPR
ncbi:MAG: S8 family peptidase [bacterium]